MPLQVNNLPRVFKVCVGNGEMVLDDPNPNLTPEEVQAHFAALYPEVASAKVEGPILKEDKQEFILRSGSVGVKG